MLVSITHTVVIGIAQNTEKRVAFQVEILLPRPPTDSVKTFLLLRPTVRLYISLGTSD